MCGGIGDYTLLQDVDNRVPSKLPHYLVLPGSPSNKVGVRGIEDWPKVPSTNAIWDWSFKVRVRRRSLLQVSDRCCHRGGREWACTCLLLLLLLLLQLLFGAV